LKNFDIEKNIDMAEATVMTTQWKIFPIFQKFLFSSNVFPSSK
jgi:hypothetical protein